MYFKNLPKFEYDFNVSVEMVDMFKRIAFTKDTKNSMDAFTPYIVGDGETPDDVAQKVYGDARWFWLVLLCNNIINVEKEWPKSQSKIQRRFTDTGFLDGDSLFVYENRDFQKGDIIVKAESCTPDVDGCDETGITASMNNYAIVDGWDENLFKIDVKLKGSEYALSDSDEIFHYRKEANYFYSVPSAGGCSADSQLFRVKKVSSIIKGVDKFKYGNLELSPFSQVTGGGPLPDGPPDATDVPYTPVYSSDGMCGLTGTILYKYMTDGETLPVGFKAISVEDTIYIENYEKRKIKLLHPRFLLGVYDEFKLLINGNLPRGTTKIIELKG